MRSVLFWNKLICLVALISSVVWASQIARANTAHVVVDIHKQAQPVLGFGVNIWPGDTTVGVCFDELSMNWAKLWLGCGGSSDSILSGRPLSYYRNYWKTWIDANPKRITADALSINLAVQHDVTLIVVLGHVPKCWVTKHGGYNYLKPGDDIVNGYARWFAAGIASLADRGVHAPYVEIYNEPDCDPMMPPAQYEALLKACRDNLDILGLDQSKVKIAGPGAGHINFGASGDRYVNVLDAKAVSDLGAWANHGYVWDKSLNESPRSYYSMSRSIPAEAASFRAKDPVRRLPWIESEYGATSNNFHGITYVDQNAKRSAVPFATREFADTLSLFEGGVNALIYWEGADQSWTYQKWGFLDRKGKPRPVFDALSMLIPKLASRKFRVVNVAPGAFGLVSGAFTDGTHLVVGLANPTGAIIDASVSVTGARNARFSAASTFTEGTVGTVVLEPDSNGIYHTSLPPDGAMSIEFLY